MLAISASDNRTDSGCSLRLIARGTINLLMHHTMLFLAHFSIQAKRPSHHSAGKVD
jgi:hypothetical protein